MHRNVIDIARAEIALLDEAKGKSLEFHSSHARIETRLSLQDVLHEGKDKTIRRYSQAQIVPIESVTVYIKPPATLIALKEPVKSDNTQETVEKDKCCRIM
jgi:hypothetical protein